MVSVFKVRLLMQVSLGRSFDWGWGKGSLLFLLPKWILTLDQGLEAEVGPRWKSIEEITHKKINYSPSG
jgi:hypothetical protein